MLKTLSKLIFIALNDYKYTILNVIFKLIAITLLGFVLNRLLQ